MRINHGVTNSPGWGPRRSPPKVPWGSVALGVWGTVPFPWANAHGWLSPGHTDNAKCLFCLWLIFIHQ